MLNISETNHNHLHSYLIWSVHSFVCRYVSRDPKLTSEVYHCKRGINQTFLQTSHIFNPTLYPNDLQYNSDRDIYPLVIHCVTDEGPEETKQSHTTVCVIDHHSDGTYGLRALKQKIFVDGLCYLLQEIYGIENKCNNKVRKRNYMFSCPSANAYSTPQLKCHFFTVDILLCLLL